MGEGEGGLRYGRMGGRRVRVRVLSSRAEGDGFEFARRGGGV